MNETLARAALMTVMQQIVDDWTLYPLVVEPDNRDLVDQVLQLDPYVKVEIDFLGSEQADMADVPLEKHVGQMMIYVVSRKGSGTVDGAILRDFIRPYFSLKKFGVLQCHSAEIYKSKEIKGWEYWPILLNFYFHSLAH